MAYELAGSNGAVPSAVMVKCSPPHSYPRFPDDLFTFFRKAAFFPDHSTTPATTPAKNCLRTGVCKRVCFRVEL